MRRYEPEIAELIHERDVTLAAHRPKSDVAEREDRDLEVTSELTVA